MFISCEIHYIIDMIQSRSRPLPLLSIRFQSDLGENAFRWALSLISKILVRAINEGSELKRSEASFVWFGAGGEAFFCFFLEETNRKKDRGSPGPSEGQCGIVLSVLFQGSGHAGNV